MATPEPLVLPRGVRFPRDDEFPRGRERERAQVAAARLTTGYVHQNGRTDAYEAYFQANVHSHELWNAFRALALALLPDVGAPIIGIKDASPVLGPYTDRDAAIAALEPHAYQLQHDGFLEFGIIFQYKGRTEEVFVPSAKYLMVWTNQALEVERVFSELGIPKLPTLQFIDEFPRVSESLTTPDGNAGWQSVLDAVRHAFEELPQPEPPANDV